jgi:hypothetical protein
MDERCSSTLEGINRADLERVFFTLVFLTAADNTTSAMSIITHPTTPMTKITAFDSAHDKSAEGIGREGNL